MVQQVFNNYSPNYNYHYRPQQLLHQAPVANSNVTMPEAQFVSYQPGVVASQLAQRVPNVVYNYPQNAETAQAVQQVFTQPLYNNAFYSVPANNNINKVDYCPWVQDPELKLALNKLADITHDPRDVAYLNSIGITPPFNSGKEALDFIAQNQVSVEFGDFGDSLAHAQYSNADNKILINQNYKGKMTKTMALAIADAIYHEAGHAKDKDGYSSIQEELNCLSLNVMGFRYQQRHYPCLLNSDSAESRLINDGVGLYPKLFFDNDPQKKALINRVTEKYGFLPLTTPNHDIKNKPMALQIKENFINAEQQKKLASSGPLQNTNRWA